MARAPALHAGGLGFESPIDYFMLNKIIDFLFGKKRTDWYVCFYGKPYYKDHIYHDIIIKPIITRKAKKPLVAKYPCRIDELESSGRNMIIGPFDTYDNASLYLSNKLKFPAYCLNQAFRV